MTSSYKWHSISVSLAGTHFYWDSLNQYRRLPFVGNPGHMERPSVNQLNQVSESPKTCHHTHTKKLSPNDPCLPLSDTLPLSPGTPVYWVLVLDILEKREMTSPHSVPEHSKMSVSQHQVLKWLVMLITQTGFHPRFKTMAYQIKKYRHLSVRRDSFAESCNTKEKGGGYFLLVLVFVVVCLRIYWMIVRLEGLKGIILIRSCDP